MTSRSLFSLTTVTRRAFSSTPRACVEPFGQSSGSNPLSNFLDRDGPSASNTGEGSNGSPDILDSPGYRQLMERTLSAQLEEGQRRRAFSPYSVIKPTELAESALFAPRPRRTKPPLLGPRSTIAKAQDPFYITRTNPVDHALNPNFVLSFINPLGRIKPRWETGLTRRTQKKIGKMVKRARAMGIIPIFSNRVSQRGLGDYKGY